MKARFQLGRRLSLVFFVALLILSPNWVQARQASSRVDVQAPEWTIRVGFAHANPDGTFRDRRGNGKLVRSHIDDAAMFLLSLERRLSDRFGITFGGLGASSHDFVIRQDFPDDTRFEARDAFRFRAVTAGATYHFLKSRHVTIVAELYLLFAWFEDVSLVSAGPPYDRTVPIDVDVDSLPGVGTNIRFDIRPRGGRLSVSPWAGFVAVRFSGPFPDDPSIPGSGGEIGVGFNPVMAGVSVGVGL